MERLCTMCGKPVADLAAVLCGLGELHNRVLRDGPMHMACARAATTLCPHLARQEPNPSYEMFWIMLELQARESTFETADESRVMHPGRGLWEIGEEAGVWSAHGVVLDCPHPIVRWRILSERFPRDCFHFFGYVDRVITEISMAEFIDWYDGYYPLKERLAVEHLPEAERVYQSLVAACQADETPPPA